MALRFPRRARRRLVAAAIGAVSVVGAAALAQEPAKFTLTQTACVNPQAECGGLVTQGCLERLGAGSRAAEAVPADCDAQMGQYRECLAAIVETCSVTQQQAGGGASEAERYSFDQLASLGGLIAEPRTLIEYYNNALVYSRRGDTLSARKMYEQAIAQDAIAIDIHLDYVGLLKAQEGLVGAREAYAELARRQADNPTTRLIAATLLPDAKREEALRALAEKGDGYGPAWFEIARLYSLDRLGDQSLSDQRTEKAALEAFTAADEAGGVYRWFLRKDVVEDWRKDAARRLAVYGAHNIDIQPIALTAMPSNDSWTLSLNLAEAARAIRYRVDGGEVKDTGAMTVIDRRTGAPTPRSFFQLPLKTAKAEIDVWYDDVRSQEQGPFQLRFDAADAYTAFTRDVMDNLSQNWVQGRDYDGKYLIYFTQLISYRCGLKEVAYGVDRDAPDRKFPLAPCDPASPFGVGEATVYLTYEARPERMVVRLTYADGSQSEQREFRFGG